MPGANDFILKVVAKDLKAYGEFMNQKLTQIQGIQRIQSSFVIDSFVKKGKAGPGTGPRIGRLIPFLDQADLDGTPVCSDSACSVLAMSCSSSLISSEKKRSFMTSETPRMSVPPWRRRSHAAVRPV